MLNPQLRVDFFQESLEGRPGQPHGPHPLQAADPRRMLSLEKDCRQQKQSKQEIMLSRLKAIN